MEAELLLHSAERYSFLIATSANTTEKEQRVQTVRMSRQNIGKLIYNVACTKKRTTYKAEIGQENEALHVFYVEIT